MQQNIARIDELPELAKKLLEFTQDEHFFIFIGDMGAGKTSFIKAFCKVLGVEELVSSPTFSIVNEYQAKEGKVYHFDFYRLKSVKEAYDLGYEDYFYSGAYCLVEWPQLVEDLLPAHYIKVEIKLKTENEREFIFTSCR